MPELKQLLIFHAVVEHGSFSRASVVLSIGQPVLSRQIKALETELSTRLFERLHRGVMLTGGGALLGDLDLALREQTGLAVSIADESLNCVALGTGKALEYEKQLRHAIDYDS